MKQFLRNNGLSLCFLILFLGSWLGQIIFGLLEYNKERLEAGFSSVPLFTYLKSGHFFQATFENWQSEFLSVFVIVLLSIYLRQIGSSQSKPVDAPHMETGNN